MADDWNTWASATLTGIGAPVTPTNLDTLARWSRAEKPAGQPLQWNNPLNTTQNEPGATSVNSVGVKSFSSLSSGVAATVTTLLNGNYNSIVSSLRASKPPEEWEGEARRELGVWGTGIAWINSHVSAPVAIGTPPSGAGTQKWPWPLNGTFDPTDLLIRVALITLGLIIILVGLSIAFKNQISVVIDTAPKIAEVAAAL